MAFRKKFYESLAELHKEPDQSLTFYNRKRAHQGHWTKCRTPHRAFLDGVKEMTRADAA